MRCLRIASRIVFLVAEFSQTDLCSLILWKNCLKWRPEWLPHWSQEIRFSWISKMHVYQSSNLILSLLSTVSKSDHSSVHFAWIPSNKVSVCSRVNTIDFRFQERIPDIHLLTESNVLVFNLISYPWSYLARGKRWGFSSAIFLYLFCLSYLLRIVEFGMTVSTCTHA